MTYGPLYYGMRKGKELDSLVREKLQAAGLYDEVKNDLHRSALQLSGGQQQRLCIARALTADPEVLLLDEPCSALDVKSTAVIEQLLLDLKDRYGIASLIVTHNLFQARRIADWVLFMGSGGVNEYGKAQDIFTSPKMPETRDYLSGLIG